MHRKDYALIADALRRARYAAANDVGALVGNSDAALELADALKRDNPRFDRAKFLAACGINA